ncbi:MAG: hypothetical protein FWH21_10015 [Kiritimatiellaeota bacterium]|nr:hypothetical protein [Kiritimatiellota bacterium]
MRDVTVTIISCLFFWCAVQAQEAGVPSLDQQFSALVKEIEAWKKEMTQNVASRTSIETLLRQGVTFQKAYNAEADSIVKGDLLDEYVKQRDALLAKLPVTAFMSYNKDMSYTYPYTLVFEADDLEVDARRPFLFQRKAAAVSSGVVNTAQVQRRMLFSHKEGQRFANLLSRFVAKAKVKDPTSVSMRDLTASVQMVNAEAVIFLQFKTPAGTVGSEFYRLTAFDANLLSARIHAALKASPPPATYTEPDDLDPSTALFDGLAAEPAKGGAAASGTTSIPVSALSFDVARIKITQGQKYGYYGTQRVQQQFDYRVSFRWGGEQPLSVQVIMCLVTTVNNKLAIVGRDVKEVTLEPRRAQELLMSAEQKIPGPTAGTVIVQCFSGGRLLKSYSSTPQHKKLAEMGAEIETQLAPLYQNPQTYLLGL